jgi:phosphatidylglycerol:prolipoprotein diacylglycerol transferase
MLPKLIDFGPIQIHSYGLLIVIGFIVAMVLARAKGNKLGMSLQKLTDIGFWSLLFGLVGGRVLFVITQWSSFRNDLWGILKFWEGGLVFYGGFIGGAAAFIFFSRRWNIPILKGTDLAAPSLAIAHVFGRLGCFSAGCCYGHGIEAHHPFAVIFSHPDSIAPRGVPLHPAQLYDAFNSFLIFVILQWLYYRRKFDGQVTATYLMLYAIGRSWVESFRGDTVRGFVLDQTVSTSQFISIFIFCGGFALYYWGWNQHRRQVISNF